MLRRGQEFRACRIFGNPFVGFLVLLICPGPAFGSKVIPASQNVEARWQSRWRTNSSWCDLEVVDVFEDPQTRYLRCGSSIIGARFLDDMFVDQSKFSAFAVQQSAIEFMVSPIKPHRVLVLGLGAGTVPNLLRGSPKGMIVDVVELSRPVIKAASKYFGYVFRKGRYGQTWNKNAIDFLAGPGPDVRYDVVLHDLYAHGENHAISSDVLGNIRDKWLREDGKGVLFLNVVAWIRRPREMEQDLQHPYLLTEAIADKISDAFGFVRAFADSIQEESSSPEVGNVMFVTSASIGKNSAAPNLAWYVPPTGDYTDPPRESHAWVVKHCAEWELLDLKRDARPRNMLNNMTSVDVEAAQKRLQVAMWEIVQPLLPRKAWRNDYFEIDLARSSSMSPGATAEQEL